jgi:hypothetical protein
MTGICAELPLTTLSRHSRLRGWDVAVGQGSHKQSEEAKRMFGRLAVTWPANECDWESP